jgi:uncharacterized membrane protein YfcA
MARPNLSYLKNAILALVGIPCGIVTGLSGMAPNTLFESLMVWLLGKKAVELPGTTMAMIATAAISSLLAYAQIGAVHWLYALAFMAGNAAGAVVCSVQMRRKKAIPQAAEFARAFGAVLTTLVAAVMICDGLGILHIHAIPGDFFGVNSSQRQVLPGYSPLNLTNPTLQLASVAILGFLVSLIALYTRCPLALPVLHYAVGLPMVVAQGCMLAQIAWMYLASSLGMARLKKIDAATTFALCFGAFFGGLIGSRIIAMNYASSRLLVIVGIITLAILVVRPQAKTAMKNPEA